MTIELTEEQRRVIFKQLIIELEAELVYKNILGLSLDLRGRLSESLNRIVGGKS